MTFLGAALYGVIQGITEFLPVSSSGHLALAQNFGWFSTSAESADMAFNVLLHFGTLLSVVIVYRRDVLSVISGGISVASRPFSKERRPLAGNEKLFLYLCAASVPLIPAALLADRIEALSGNSIAVGCLLMMNGAVLWAAEKLSSGKVTLPEAGVKRALTVGLFQAFGVLPGISRSGSTITGGLFCDLSGKEAVRFSFLMSIPAILGAGAIKLKDLGKGLSDGMLPVCLTGAASAAIVGAASIKLLQYLSKNKRFTPFAVYCIAAGAAAVVYDILK